MELQDLIETLQRAKSAEQLLLELHVAVFFQEKGASEIPLQLRIKLDNYFGDDYE